MTDEPRTSVWSAVARMRVIRRFADRPLDPDHLDRILRAGRRAGSAKNLQRWMFVVVRDRAHLKELSAVGRYADHLAGAAVAIALLTPDPKAEGEPLSLMFDLGLAAESMVLVAWELGIGSAPATVFDHDVAKALLGYPDDWHCEYILSFGYPADPDDLTRPLRPGGRRPLEEIVREERW